MGRPIPRSPPASPTLPRVPFEAPVESGAGCEDEEEWVAQLVALGTDTRDQAGSAALRASRSTEGAAPPGPVSSTQESAIASRTIPVRARATSSSDTSPGPSSLSGDAPWSRDIFVEPSLYLRVPSSPSPGSSSANLRPPPSPRPAPRLLPTRSLSAGTTLPPRPVRRLSSDDATIGDRVTTSNREGPIAIVPLRPVQSSSPAIQALSSADVSAQRAVEVITASSRMAASMSNLRNLTGQAAATAERGGGVEERDAILRRARQALETAVSFAERLEQATRVLSAGGRTARATSDTLSNDQSATSPPPRVDVPSDSEHVHASLQRSIEQLRSAASRIDRMLSAPPGPNASSASLRPYVSSRDEPVRSHIDAHVRQSRERVELTRRRLLDAGDDVEREMEALLDPSSSTADLAGITREASSGRSRSVHRAPLAAFAGLSPYRPWRTDVNAAGSAAATSGSSLRRHNALHDRNAARMREQDQARSNSTSENLASTTGEDQQQLAGVRIVRSVIRRSSGELVIEETDSEEDPQSSSLPVRTVASWTKLDRNGDLIEPGDEDARALKPMRRAYIGR